MRNKEDSVNQEISKTEVIPNIPPQIEKEKKTPLKGKNKLKNTVKKVIDTQTFSKNYKFSAKKKALEAVFI